MSVPPITPPITPHTTPPDWNQLPSLSVVQPPYLSDEFTVVLPTENGDLRLQMSRYGVRISSPWRIDLEQYGLLSSQLSPLRLTLENEECRSTISSAAWQLDICLKSLHLRLLDQQGNCLFESTTDAHFTRRHRLPTLAKAEQGWYLSLALESGESIYGLGEKWGALNRRGQLLRSCNTDALGVNAELSYKNVPFCWSTKGWGVFVHSGAAVTHAVGYAPWSHRSYCLFLEDDDLDVFLLAVPLETENKAAALIANYTELTGRAPLPPKWSTGIILSKAYYKDAEEILSVAREVRERQMPCDVITFDGRAWQNTEDRFAFEWCKKRYPEPQKVLDQLKAMHFKICVWEYPLISSRHRWFDEFAAKGWLITHADTGKAYEYFWDRQGFGKVLTPLPASGVVDFTHPDAYDFWKQAHEPLFASGIDMIKADFGEQLDAEHMLAANGASGESLRNIYSHLYNRCVFEAATEFASSGAFLFSRSASIASQRYNSQWGGDPQADWEGMMANIRGGLSWGLTGSPFYATDVGGFYADRRDAKLYVRWTQAAIFSAHFRFHGIGDRTPWSYTKEAEAAVMKAVKWRYQLQSYTFEAMRVATESGLPVQQAMVLAFPEERQSWSFDNQFMFGNELLVAPCFRADGKVEFYLPEGEWCRFDLDGANAVERMTGGRVLALQLELNEIAVFARQGAKIPIDSLVEYTAQRPLDYSPMIEWCDGERIDRSVHPRINPQE